MSLSASAIENQITANLQEEGDLILELRSISEGSPARSQKIFRLLTIQNANRQWAREYKRRTGIDFVLVPRMIISQEEIEEANRARRKQEEARVHLRNQVPVVRNHLQLLKDTIQTTMDAAEESWLSIVGSGLSRTFSGSYWATPIIIRKQTVPKAEAELQKAEAWLASGDLAKAQTHLNKAVAIVNSGVAMVNEFQDRVNRGAKRAITTIKISAAIGTALVTGGASLGIGGSAAVAGVGKAAEEGTTLGARWAMGENVSSDDVSRALANVLLESAGAAGGSHLAKTFAKPLASKIYRVPLDKLSQGQIDKVGSLISQYFAANYKAIVRAIDDHVDKGKPVTWDFWATLLAPAFTGITHELLKEKDVRDLLVEEVTQPL